MRRITTHGREAVLSTHPGIAQYWVAGVLRELVVPTSTRVAHALDLLIIHEELPRTRQVSTRRRSSVTREGQERQ